jgi:hypothetical protein
LSPRRQILLSSHAAQATATGRRPAA